MTRLKRPANACSSVHPFLSSTPPIVSRAAPVPLEISYTRTSCILHRCRLRYRLSARLLQNNIHFASILEAHLAVPPHNDRFRRMPPRAFARTSWSASAIPYNAWICRVVELGCYDKTSARKDFASQTRYTFTLGLRKHALASQPSTLVENRRTYEEKGDRRHCGPNNDRVLQACWRRSVVNVFA